VGSAYRMDSSEVNLIFAAPQNQSHPLAGKAVKRDDLVAAV
jgi:hypothetical protein